MSLRGLFGALPNYFTQFNLGPLKRYVFHIVACNLSFIYANTVKTSGSHWSHIIQFDSTGSPTTTVVS